MNASPTNISGSSQNPSVRRWAFAFFAPTYVCVAMASLLPLGLGEMKDGLGLLLVVLFAIANAASLWLCLQEAFRVQRSSWQRPVLILATVYGLAAQTVVVFLFFVFLWGRS